MELSPDLADAIVERYRPETVATQLRRIIRKHGLAALTEDARRELVLNIGDDRRFGNRLDARNRAIRLAHAAE